MDLEIPALSLVVLLGANRDGKTVFTQRHFRPTEIVSMDALRRQICEDAQDPDADADAFDLLQRIVALRLQRGLLTVVDAADLPTRQRGALLRVAREQYTTPAALVFDLPEPSLQAHHPEPPLQTHHPEPSLQTHDPEPSLQTHHPEPSLQAHDPERPRQATPPEATRRHAQQAQRAFTRLKNEGFGPVYRFTDAAQVDAATLRRAPLAVDRREQTGPFDIIGDVHGCADELEELLALLGYTKTAALPTDPAAAFSPYPYRYTHTARRSLAFVGDLVDRGPRILDACMLALHSCAAGHALAVPGNHDDRFLRWLKNHEVEMAHGLQNSVAEFEALPAHTRPALQTALLRFFEDLPAHLLLDDGRLALAHAGVRQRMLGRDTRRVRDFALYGETHGETDEAGRPIRYNWAADYHGQTRIVYGHTPIETPHWQNLAINIDTGCVYGGRLTALRYPELELVSVPARRVYYERK